MKTIISRKDAYAQSKVRYYTGIPCKAGHTAERYVSTGNCTDCLNPYRQRRHPTRKDLQPYVCPKLWVPEGTTPAQYEALATYLQVCIEAFFEHAKKVALAAAVEKNPKVQATEDGGYNGE